MLCLDAFKSHSLEEQASSTLMDRVDTKFMLPWHKLESYLSTLNTQYTVLEINKLRESRYDSLYFDSDDLCFYMAHHNGKLNRNKVRLRRYLESDIAFLEVKNKTNKFRTVKQRIPYIEGSLYFKKINQFVRNAIGQSLSSLNPTLRVTYRRTTLMHRERGERVTIDTDLGFYSLINNHMYRLPHIGIVEIKNKNSRADSIAQIILKKEGITPIKFSKYCIGLGLTHAGTIKKNNFKPVFNRLEKLSDEPLIVDTFSTFNKFGTLNSLLDLHRKASYGLSG